MALTLYSSFRNRDLHLSNFPTIAYGFMQISSLVGYDVAYENKDGLFGILQLTENYEIFLNDSFLSLFQTFC